MKKNSTMTLRRLLMLLAAASLLLVCLAGCNNDAPSDDPPGDPSGTVAQTDPTDAPTDPTKPPETEPEALMGTVTAENLNVRSNPSTDSTVLRQLDINTRVVIIEQKVVGDVTWGRIAEGWVNMNYILLDGQEPPEPTEPADEPTEPTDGVTGTVTASELNIRDSGDSDGKVVGKYKKGDKIEILETRDGWGRTDKGWVSMKYVELDEEDDQKEEEDDKKDAEIESDGSTKVLGHGVVDIGSLNVRSGPGTKYDVIDKVAQGERYAYYQKSGSWVRIEDGWISTGYFYIEGTKGDKAGTGTVTSDDLNIRTGPGTDYKTNGSYSKGDKVEILHQIGGWGYTSKGWISMKYVDMGDEASGSYTTGTGTVTASELNIRKSAGSDAEVVGKYVKGDKIEILEVKGSWGRTDKGWVSLEYVKMDKSASTTGTVTASELNIRKGPGADYESVGKYVKGDKIEILETKDGWGRTDKGWVSMTYVKMN